MMPFGGESSQAAKASRVTVIRKLVRPRVTAASAYPSRAQSIYGSPQGGKADQLGRAAIRLIAPSGNWESERQQSDLFLSLGDRAFLLSFFLDVSR
jgi:hypothetical protein